MPKITFIGAGSTVCAKILTSLHKFLTGRGRIHDRQCCRRSQRFAFAQGGQHLQPAHARQTAVQYDKLPRPLPGIAQHFERIFSTGNGTGFCSHARQHLA